MDKNDIDKKIKKNQQSDGKKDKKNYLHAEHRGRMRERYKKNGFDSFEFHEILELILYYPIPRINTNVIAHDLEEKFGKSLSNILEADENALKAIKGVSENTALFFKLLADITRRYNIERASKQGDIIGKHAHEDYLIAYYTGMSRETVVMLSLNNRMERISTDIIYEGSVNSTKVDRNKMAKIALNNNASAVIVAHNHPHGQDYPSADDIETTRQLSRLFNDISINFVDHYVVAETKISSIMEKLVHDFLK
ncbi:MAG: hypothetical protein FWD71_10675 [Oscillospiraceae bacterium]|nr:hypothetical protein [Oscillospiraceae bacterium]